MSLCEQLKASSINTEQKAAVEEEGLRWEHACDVGNDTRAHSAPRVKLCLPTPVPQHHQSNPVRISVPDGDPGRKEDDWEGAELKKSILLK